jgi:hypothetical protein
MILSQVPSTTQPPFRIQYVPNGSDYARIKVGGKVIRHALRTATFSTARLKLLDFLREQKQPVQPVGETMTFRAARELFARRLGTPDCRTG